MPRKLSVKGGVDVRLPVLNPRADRKGLRDQVRAASVQRGKGIPRRMPDREDHRIRWELLSIDPNAAEPPSTCDKLVRPGMKPHLAAQTENLLPYAFHHPAQQVGADMRLCLHQNIRRRAVCGQNSKNFSAERVVDACGQLAIREGARAALAKLNVVFRIEDAALPIPFHRGYPLIDRSAPLQHKRPIALSCQHQGRKESRRTQTDHHRAVKKALVPMRQNERPGSGSRGNFRQSLGKQHASRAVLQRKSDG